MRLNGAPIEDNSGLPSGQPLTPATDQMADADDEDEDEAELDDEDDEEDGEGQGEAASSDDDLDDMTLSLAAMESAVYDDVMAQIDVIEKLFKKYAALQDKKVAAACKGKALTAAQDDELAEMKIQLVEEMQNICLHNSRLDSLGQQLSDLNRHMTT